MFSVCKFQAAGGDGQSWCQWPAVTVLTRSSRELSLASRGSLAVWIQLKLSIYPYKSRPYGGCLVEVLVPRTGVSNPHTSFHDVLSFPMWVRACLVTQPCQIHCNPKNIGVGSLSLLQGIFLTQKSTLGLLNSRQILYQLIYQGSSQVQDILIISDSKSDSRLRGRLFGGGLLWIRCNSWDNRPNVC